MSNLFPELPPMSDRLRDSLANHLSCWPTLQKFLSTKPNEDTVKRLIVLEHAGNRREQILDRLVGRLTMMRRRKLRKTLKLP
jgi:hypothetical protein